MSSLTISKPIFLEDEEQSFVEPGDIIHAVGIDIDIL